MDDESAFREFASARMGKLSSVAYLLTGDHHAAEDLVQAVLVKIARNWRRIHAVSAPDAYVRQMLYHEHVSAWRRRGDEEPVAVLPEPPPSADLADRAVRRILLQQALARLTARQRAVIVLRFFEDLSEAETADVLGCSVGTVKSQTHHAIGRLRVLAPELADLYHQAEEFAG
jgi:RNA polymerase sigma-70 factor (sigma-E family)